MRWIVILVALVSVRVVHADRSAVKCDNQSTADVEVDGLLDEWPKQTLERVGNVNDAQIELRCSWDGTALAIALDMKDDKLVRIAKGPGQQDHVTVKIGAGAKPVLVDVYPGNSMAKSKIAKPGRVAAADALQPKGFAIELRVPAAAIAGLSAATPSLDLDVVFTDADRATGGDTNALELAATIELGDRKDLLEDFLREVRLKKSDVRVDRMANLDPDRRGNERIVTGGTVIGVLTDQFAYVTLPAAKAADVKSVELVPFGARATQVIAAVVRQTGNGGARELLMLWTVRGGQLQPLGQIEVKKEMSGNALASAWKVVPSKTGPALWVEPQPAVGFTAQTWNEAPAEDADAIVPPWDTSKGGVIYTVKGGELQRHDIAKKKPRR